MAEYSAVLASTGSRKPTFAAEFAWRTHLLHPVAYVQACQAVNQLSRVVEHSPEATASYADYAVQTRTEDQTCPGWLDIDLIGAMRHQEGFMRTMVANRTHFETESAVRRAIVEYNEFMSKFNHSQQDREPTPMVDMIWHTHMQFPQRYATECRHLAGTFVDHHDDIAT